MTESTSRATRDPGDPRDLDARAVVEAIVEQRATADRAEARLLALAVHFVDLHPVTDEQLTDLVAGEGTPPIAEHAVEELGAALLVGYRSALGLVRDALELRYRLPRLWDLVQAGSLQPWKARQVAGLTPELSPAAVAFVDRHLAHDATRNRVPTVGRLRALVHEALLQHDPDVAAGREEAALAARGVWFDHRESTATSRLTATLDTLDALDLEAGVSDLAGQLHRLGDDSPLDVRRSRALGMLGQSRSTLDLAGGASDSPGVTEAAPAVAGGTAAATERPVLRPGNRIAAHLYVHTSLADLADLAEPAAADRASTAAPTATIEKLGPASLDLVRGWLQRADRVSVRPVLHATGAGRADVAVDQHDPPEWMREAVVLRDGHCVFPGCSIDARSCDQDHRIPFVPVDEGGPPGQTSVDALACLCRRHHRLKTFTAWRYRRLVGTDDDGTSLVHYRWTSPHGHTYLTTAAPSG